VTIGHTVSYDMGWSKRSTGKVYDSLSGHGFLIGQKVHKESDGHLYICEIVSDDDLSMRKNLLHVGNSYGNLDINIPEQIADSIQKAKAPVEHLFNNHE